VNIQEEIHQALSDIQKKVAAGNNLDQAELEILFLSSLIEEEG
jgi:hypothetical protein